MDATLQGGSLTIPAVTCTRAGLSRLSEDELLDLQARIEQERPRPAGLGEAGSGWLKAHRDVPGGLAGLLAQLATDSTFRLPMVSWAGARPAPTWLYDYRYPARGMGLALHCAELPFVWAYLDAERVEGSTGPNPP
ncbi:carboxylesterase type B [Arthrobacter sp. UYNi723]